MVHTQISPIIPITSFMLIFSPDVRSNLGSCISFTCQVSLVSFNLEQFCSLFFFFFTFMTLIFLKNCLTKSVKFGMSKISLVRFRLNIWGRKNTEMLCVLPGNLYHEVINWSRWYPAISPL